MFDVLVVGGGPAGLSAAMMLGRCRRSILVIDQGKIVERGRHRDLVEAEGKYAHLYDQFVSHSE